ncbi:MAG: methionine synthase, partial [Prevotellaceae bacterium]|nr:methionine synthase [Prevotellaceae bacterium]
NAVSLADYDMSELAYEISLSAAQLARAAADACTLKTPDQPRFVAGSMGPTNKSASMSPDMGNPAYRAVTFDGLVAAYGEQARGLVDGGADVLLIETVFDTLNAKAALVAIATLEEAVGRKLPVMLSATVDGSGRILSGQTLEAFLASVSHVNLLSIGLNCALGAEQLRPHVAALAQKSPFGVSLHPNAGLPNELGSYDQPAQEMVATMEEYMQAGWLNIVGGCCGTTPEHTALLRAAAQKYPPRQAPAPNPRTVFSGLEVVDVEASQRFICIGERNNVAGSKKFARLIREERYDEALSVAREQVERGAQLIDICMDDAMIDARSAMQHFLNLIASEPAISRAPLVIDSSNWEVIVAGLKCVQGKPLVNSISLREGEEEFLRRAALIHRYGAAAVVMLFDEEGQAATYERKVAIAERSYRLLTAHGFPPQDIVFDPNILSIATGIAEHNGYAVAFVRACAWIKENLPHAKISGGVSNLSFAFRGNDMVREALHAVFLHHAAKAGMDMGIVNAGQLKPYRELAEPLRSLAEDVALNRREDAVERLLRYASGMTQAAPEGQQPAPDSWRQGEVEQRLKHALLHGVADCLEADLREALVRYPSPMKIVEEVLMEAMNTVGDLFGSGKMFLPQVVKSATIMKKSIDILSPMMAAAGEGQEVAGKKMLLATVRGDVHDIGKNIVSVVLKCNSYQIIDLGVMVPCEAILAAAREHRPDVVGLSGLITPSLEEMQRVAAALHGSGLNIPLVVGGASTSELHTAVKLDAEYPGHVFYVKDASRAAHLLRQLTQGDLREDFLRKQALRFAELRSQYEEGNRRKQQRAAAAAQQAAAPQERWKDKATPAPAAPGLHVWKGYDIATLVPYIDWAQLFFSWNMPGRFPEILSHPQKGSAAQKLYDDAREALQQLAPTGMWEASAAVGLYEANAEADDIVLLESGKERLRLPQHRDPTGRTTCLADLITPLSAGVKDYLATFALSIAIKNNADKKHREAGDEYHALLLETLSNVLADAFAEHLHERVRKELWGYAKDERLSTEDLLRCRYRGFRPAVGYPSYPDHSAKKLLFDLMSVPQNTGATLTETYMMQPPSSVCGLMLPRNL